MREPDPTVAHASVFDDPWNPFDDDSDLARDGLSVVDDWAACAGDPAASLDQRPPSASAVMDAALSDAVASQTVINVEAARQLFAVCDAMRIARENPHLYLPSAGTSTNTSGPRVDASDFAQRCVAFDLAHRLHVSENLVRSLAHQGDVLMSSLPRLCELFAAGAIGTQHVRAAVETGEGIDDETAMATFDQRLAEVADRLRPGEFARRARVLRERLCVDTLQTRHEQASTRRRVGVEPDLDGMAWLNLYVPVLDAARVDARLAGTARRLKGEPGETRTLDQLRADLAIAWLAGDGTPSAATVQPVLLIDEAGRYAELLGYGPMPPNAAHRSLRTAPAFRRVFADPVTPARLVLDTSRYRPSADQKLWLRIRYGLDDDATPYLSPGADIDHVVEWQHGGTTDVGNLVPLKPRLHRLKSVTRIRLDPKPDGGIRVRTPTGYDSDPPPF